MLEFTREAARPYALRATVALDNLDAPPLFQAMNPDKPPAIEGRFDITGRLTGSGEGLRDILRARRAT